MEQEIRIETQRLTLRSLTRDDIPAIVQLLSDFEVSRWLTVVPFPYAKADGHEFLDYLETADPLDALAIIAAEGLVGVVGVGGGLGYWLGRAHHGKGYMSEAARALIDHYFSTRDVDALSSGYFTGNAASWNVLCKLGFRPDGEETAKSRAQGAEVTLKKVILTRASWAANNGR
ncbi:MAG: GNAT family N-acetyltransferase [Rhodobacteraceae bacterium]|nr:GNAT family N-acetyltransferase [Paracoccaceae bacterium]